jgi:hypothetical protein
MAGIKVTHSELESQDFIYDRSQQDISLKLQTEESSQITQSAT